MVSSVLNMDFSVFCFAKNQLLDERLKKHFELYLSIN